MATYSDGVQCPGVTGGEDFDTWIGAEIQYAPGYDPATTVITGGSVSITGPGAGAVQVLHQGVELEATTYGDPGYQAHIFAPVGTGAFEALATVEYTP